MEFKFAAVVFISVFLAELGDKTQVATLLFATDREASRVVIFLAAASALVLATGLAVLAGDLVGRFVGERTLNWAAGLGFLAIGAYTLWRA